MLQLMTEKSEGKLFGYFGHCSILALENKEHYTQLFLGYLFSNCPTSEPCGSD